MSYLSGLCKSMGELLDISAEREGLELPSGEFVAKTGKLYKILLVIATVVTLVIGLPMTFLQKDDVGILFLILGVCAGVLLPTILSYRCVVNKDFLQEEYLIVFVKRKKKILWSDVKYKKIVMARNKSIKLYDINKKCLVSFDGATVGFNRILKLAKRSSIKDIKK